MGFFDGYKEEGGLNYIGSEEKAVIIKEGLPLTFLRAWTGEGQFGPKYTVVVEYDGEERAVSFPAGKVESRDRMLDAMIEYVDVDEDAKPEDWELPVFKIAKVKQSQVLVAA